VTHPMRFGVISSRPASPQVWRDQARRAEALGYTSLLMPDHFQEQWAPIVGLTVAAEATSTLRVGTLVFDNDYRHPVVLAKEIATLDLATSGRVEFGLGAGWKRSDYDEEGLVYDRPGVRIDRMAEALTIMKALWSSPDPVHFSGAHYTIAGAVGTPQPHSRPHPTVCIGGGGKRMLTLAAQEASIVAINPTMTAGQLGAEVAATATPQAYDEKVGWVRAAAGARLADIELQCHCPMVVFTDDRDTVAAQMAPLFGVAPEDGVHLPLGLFGTVEQMCDTILERRDRYGFTYWIVPDSAFDDFAPVVAKLTGS